MYRRRGRVEEHKEFEEGVLQIDRVTKVVKGGKILKFRVIMVIGDKKGRVGIGIGKAREIPSAIKKGIADAKRNLVTVPIKNNTIPMRITSKSGAGYVFLAPAVKGTGIVAGRVVKAIAEKAGIEDLLSKTLGTANPLNVANAMLVAFRDMDTIIHRKEMMKREIAGGENENTEF
ncbi:MAG: 30S ribosomal protein S5 [Caldisericaceae bacterium]|nr:30S ribosomal protein S5 [Caldisericaceae bacterium]RLD20136.1 MAG: 30S ribosomal protein S5 [Caldisericota bacterium]